MSQEPKFVDNDGFIARCREIGNRQMETIKDKYILDLIHTAADKIEVLSSRLNNLTIPTASTHFLTPNEKFLWDQYHSALETIHSLAKRLDEFDDLKRWKQETMGVFSPLLEYADKTPGLQLGDNVINAAVLHLEPRRVRLRAAEQAAIDWVAANIPKSEISQELQKAREEFVSQLGDK